MSDDPGPFLVGVLRNGSPADVLRVGLFFALGPLFGLILAPVLFDLVVDLPIRDPSNWPTLLLAVGAVLLLIVWPAIEVCRFLAWGVTEALRSE